MCVFLAATASKCHRNGIGQHIPYLKVMHSPIPSRMSRSKEMRNRDIVSRVVYTQVLDMGLAPVSVSCCQRRDTLGL